jgi:hypothetical protein
MPRLSTECYIPLLKIRFLRIYNLLDNTVFLNLYFSHKHKKDNYYCILYDIGKKKRYLQYFIGEDESIILWTE